MEELIGNEYDIDKLIKINHELIIKNAKLIEENKRLQHNNDMLTTIYKSLLQVKLLLYKVKKRKAYFDCYELSSGSAKSLDKARELLSKALSLRNSDGGINLLWKN